jgi:hypothetical protein
MSDNEVLSEAEEYAKALEEMGALEPEKAPEPEPDPVPDPAPEPVEAKETPAAPAPEAGVSVSEEPFPGFNALPDEVKASLTTRFAEAEAARKQAAEFEQNLRSVHNRLAPTQRELEQTRRAAQDMAARLQKIEQAQSNGAPTSDLIKKFKEQYPDEGAALEAVSQQWETQAERLTRENAELRQSVQTIRQNIDRRTAYDTLLQRHPDAMEIDRSEPFKAWFGTLSPHKRALAASSDPDAVADALDDFKRDLALAQALAASTPATPAAPAAKVKPTDIDPNPTTRRAPGLRANAAGSSEADEYAATLLAAGYSV